MPVAALRCTKCGRDAPAGQRFCEQCGGVLAAPPPPAPSPAPIAAACARCGAALKPGARFCAGCGAQAAHAAPAQPAAPPKCAACGVALAAGVRFCAACGTPVAQQGAPLAPALQAAPRTIALACSACGAALRPGARFCAGCGATNVPGAVPAAPRPALQGAPSAQWFATLTWTQVAAAGGFALVLLGSFFSWFSASGGGASATGGAFDDNAQYRIGDWLGTSDLPIDGLLVLAAGVAGLAVMAAMLTGRLPGAQAWMYVGALGGASVALGVLEIQFIASRPTGPGFSINPGFGLYFVVIGGALAALSRFIPAKPVQSQR